MGIQKLRLALALALIVVIGLAIHQLPTIAAGGLLYPSRHRSLSPIPQNCSDRAFEGEGVTLRGWDCRAEGHRRGSLIYLHGTADNRGSGIGVIRRYTAKGFEVVAYDSRRHGESSGEACTYGYFEKRDLARVIDTLPAEPVILFGTSLGAAVALQAAATDSRVAAIVAVEVFSDLESIARYRAPGILPEFIIQKAFRIAEAKGAFSIVKVSPVESAGSIRVPVLLIHGAADRDTPPEHSQRVFSALQGYKQLIRVDGAGHNQSLSHAEIWTRIDAWIDGALTN